MVDNFVDWREGDLLQGLSDPSLVVRFIGFPLSGGLEHFRGEVVHQATSVDAVLKIGDIYPHFSPLAFEPVRQYNQRDYP